MLKCCIAISSAPSFISREQHLSIWSYYVIVLHAIFIQKLLDFSLAWEIDKANGLFRHTQENKMIHPTFVALSHDKLHT